MKVVYTCVLALTLASCSPQGQQDLTLAFDVAQAAEAAYAGNPKADPKVVATMEKLLDVADGALQAWKDAPPGSTVEQQAAAAAIAALVAYEASQNIH